MTTSEYFSSINDVSVKLDIPAHTLRYWEKQFPTMIRPTTGAGGRRYYRPETVASLETIKELLYKRGMTIMGVKKLIRDGKFTESPDTDFAPATDHRVPTTDISGIDDAINLLEHARDILKS